MEIAVQVVSRQHASDFSKAVEDALAEYKDHIIDVTYSVNVINIHGVDTMRYTAIISAKHDTEEVTR